MKNLKSNVNGIFLCIFEIAVGILLLINPIAFTAGIITGGGVILLVTGVIGIVKYFRTEAKEAASGQYLVKGLVALMAGAFCAFKSDWFIVTFPALTIIYGIVVLITGLGKVQLTFDMIRKKNKKWFLGIISALLSVICAVIILNNPFASAAVLWMFTGISMIAEAVIDIIALIVSARENTQE